MCLLAAVVSGSISVDDLSTDVSDGVVCVLSSVARFRNSATFFGFLQRSSIVNSVGLLLLSNKWCTVCSSTLQSGQVLETFSSIRAMLLLSEGL